MKEHILKLYRGESPTIKDSPFYVEYTGKIDEHWTVTTTESFKKTLAKHLKDKYPNEKNKSGKHNFSKCVRFILENYLNQQCISRKTYNYSIVAISSDKQLTNNKIYPYDVLKHKSVKEHILTGHSKRIYWLKKNKDEFNEKYDYGDLSEIGKLVDKYKNKFESDKIFVVDLPLNNYFDEYVDGIYTYDAENKGMHRGVNLITTIDKIYCVVYTWYINHYYNPMIWSIEVAELDTTMQDLSQINSNAFLMFSKSIDVHDIKFPKNDIESLENLIKGYDEQIKSHYDEIDELEESKANVQELIDKRKSEINKSN